MQQQDRQSRHHEQTQDLGGRNLLQLPSIVESGVHEGHRRSSTLSIDPDANAMPVFPGHDFGSVSPVESGSLPAEYYRSSQSSGMAIHAEHLSPAMMHNPKRAYRQRRKDPSCDACRERKVKVG